MNSKDIAVGYALGYNDGLGQGGGATYNGYLRAVLDNKSGQLNIIVGEIPEKETEEQYADNYYTYTAVEFSKDIETKKANPDGTSTTRTQTFKKTIITQLINSIGQVVMHTDYDSDTGIIKGIYDKNDIPIYLEEWRKSDG